MRKSEKIANQFMSVINLLDLADNKLQKISVEYADQSMAYEFHNKIQNIIEEFEDFMYETVAPIEIEEDERENKIQKLEKELAELRAME